MPRTRNRPSVYEYTDHRRFLRDMCDYMIELHRGQVRISFASISRVTGFRSHTFLKRVIQGEKNLSLESVERISQAFKLSPSEAKHFRTLTQFNQAHDTDEKLRYSMEILKSDVVRKAHPLKRKEANLYSYWYYVPIREILAIPKVSQDPKAIAKMLNPPISAQQAEKAIRELEELGLIVRDERGRLKRADDVISAAEGPDWDSISKNAFRKWHQEMAMKAYESVDRFEPKDRSLSGVTLGLTQEQFKKLKVLLSEFREQVLSAGNESDKKGNRIYQVNLQLFPVTDETSDEGQG